jgi:hypothetical protein
MWWSYIVRVLGQQAVPPLLSLRLCTAAEMVANLREALLDCSSTPSATEVIQNPYPHTHVPLLGAWLAMLCFCWYLFTEKMIKGD